MIDNTPLLTAKQMEAACAASGVGYLRVPDGDGSHDSALNYAAKVADSLGTEYWGTLDHDVFPRGPVSLVDKIDKAGFYGVGQRHAPSQRRYLFPGFAFWSRKWLDGRIPNYSGIRGELERDDGDCGSMLHELFTEEDWARMYLGEHGYGFLRPEDRHGLQSFGFEYFDTNWVHFSNASGWKVIPDLQGRNRLMMDMLEGM